MVTVTHRVGKLVAVRVQSPVTYREATLLKPRMEQLIGRMTAPVFLVADLSDARVYSPDVAEKIMAALAANYPTVRRTGVVVHPGSALGGQISPTSATRRTPSGRRGYVSGKWWATSASCSATWRSRA